jgi:hypothetical protein
MRPSLRSDFAPGTDLRKADVEDAKLDGQQQLNSACGTNPTLPPEDHPPALGTAGPLRFDLARHRNARCISNSVAEALRKRFTSVS